MTKALICLTLLTWGVSGVFDKKALEISSNRNVFLIFHLFSLPVVLVILTVLHLFYPGWQIHLDSFLWQGASGSINMLAVVAYYMAMCNCDVSYVLGITAAYPVMTQLLAVFCLDEKFSSTGLAAASLVAVGVCLIGSTKPSQKKKLSTKQLCLTIFCIASVTVLWGLEGILQRKALVHGTQLECYLSMSIWEAALTLLIVGFLLLRKTKLDLLHDKRTWKFAWLAAFCVVIGNNGFIALLTLLPEQTSYVVVITACYPLVTYFFSWTFLGEQLNYRRLIGVLLVILGGCLNEFQAVLF